MRCKEFFMKDAYSFDLSDEDAKKSYNKMFYSYLKTFNRMGFKSYSNGSRYWAYRRRFFS